jgi:hypothetical protein
LLKEVFGMLYKTIALYSIDELPEAIQKKAYHQWLERASYTWAEENEKVLKAFENIFPVKIISWQYGGYGDYIRFTMTCDSCIEQLSGLRLLKYLYNNYFDYLFKGKYYSKVKLVDGKYVYKRRHSKIIKDNCCVLTGYYLDDIILEPIYNFLKNPKSYVTFFDLMQECLENWIRGCARDYEDYFSFENFLEIAQINGYLYTESGHEEGIKHGFCSL